MKILLSIVVIFIGAFYILGQAKSTSNLTGTIYDANGSVVAGAKVTATADGRVFSTTSDREGVYILTLPFNRYDPKPGFKLARYNISVESHGFGKSETKGFIFIPSQFGKMYLDIALDAASFVE